MENLLSLLVVVPFVLAAAVALWRLFAGPAGGGMRTHALPPPAGQFRVGLCVLIWCGVLWCILLIWAARQCPGLRPGAAMWEYFGVNNDTRHYLNIARYGYGTQDLVEGRHLLIVFFPLYAWLLRPFVWLGENLWFAGMALSTAFTVCGAVLQYRTVARLLSEPAAGGTVLFQFLIPGSFFFVMPQTEALFYCLSWAFLQALQDRRLVRAGLFGLLAALCRANGVLLAGCAAALLILHLRQHRHPSPCWSLPILLPFAGFGVYLAINQAVYGNPWQFTIYQRENWNNGLGFFGTTIRTLWNACGYLEGGVRIYMAGWGIAVMLAEVLILLLACRRLPVPWLLLGLAGFALANGQIWLISAQRYALGIAPLAPALCTITPRESRRGAVAGALAVLWLVYFAAFLRRDGIY